VRQTELTVEQQHHAELHRTGAHADGKWQEQGGGDKDVHSSAKR
jgi:hypothetical protein